MSGARECITCGQPHAGERRECEACRDRWRRSKGAGFATVDLFASEPPAPEACPRASTHTHWTHGPAAAPHLCPFRREIHDDHATECRCCDACRQECSDDV